MSSYLAQWDSFYVIVGSAAGALIGLQFVVMTLVADRPRIQLLEGATAFATPTIIHFCAVLLISALVRAPWPTLETAAKAWSLLGAGGVIYVLLVLRRMLNQQAYKPQFEDWLCHVMLPFAAYTMLAMPYFIIREYTVEALFSVGGGALLLLFCGIHNAWDAATYHIIATAKALHAAKLKEEASLENNTII